MLTNKEEERSQFTSLTTNVRLETSMNMNINTSLKKNSRGVSLFSSVQMLLDTSTDASNGTSETILNCSFYGYDSFPKGKKEESGM